MIKPESQQIHIRVNKYIKQQLEDILISHGMTVSEALRLCIWQIIAQNGIPYKGFVTTKSLPKDSPYRSIENSIHANFESVQTKLIQDAGRLEPMNEYAYKTTEKMRQQQEYANWEMSMAKHSKWKKDN